MLIYLLTALGLMPTFQVTKCKKLLNISMERIKLLERRRQARVRQLHRDVIELLQRKKEDKVDPLLLRVWKELCLFSVYAKIAEYCRFVQVSLKDIAGRRECPSSLEEPVASLCFAASCCAELPELQELRDIFTMKYGKQVVGSGQDLQPNCHVNKQFLDFLYANDPAEARKQALLEEIISKYNVMQDHKQNMQPEEHSDSVKAEVCMDAIDCNQLKERIDFTMELSEIEHRSEYDVDVVHEPNYVEPVCKEGMVFWELGNELANRKRILDDSEICRSALKRTYRGRKSRQNQTLEAANLNKDGMPSEDVRILHYLEQPSCSQPPNRPPPPPPPPKRAPPLPPASLQAMSIPSCPIDKEVNANTSFHRCCSTMSNDYHVDHYGNHVHPRLPMYEDLVANFTALKC